MQLVVALIPFDVRLEGESLRQMQALVLTDKRHTTRSSLATVQILPKLPGWQLAIEKNINTIF